MSLTVGSPHTLNSESVKDQVSATFFIDYKVAAEKLMALFNNIDKAHWALRDPDPVQGLLEQAIRFAPSEFWPEMARNDIKSLVARLRNWLLAMIKARRKDQTSAGLLFLNKLNLSGELVEQIKLKPVLRVLRKSLVAKDALALAAKYGLNLEIDDKKDTSQPPAQTKREIQKENEPLKTVNASPNVTPAAGSPPSTSTAQTQGAAATRSAAAVPSPKPKSELAIPKRQARQQSTTSSFSSLLLLNKRSREDEPVTEQHPEPPKKHRAAPRKKVSWKDDNELLKVRYFNVENCPTEMSQIYTEPHGTDFNPNQYVPHDFEIEFEDPRLLSQMGIKRGGYLVPEGPPSRPGMPFTLMPSPHEPEEQFEPSNPRTIPPFGPAKPSISRDIEKLLGSFARS